METSIRHTMFAGWNSQKLIASVLLYPKTSLTCQTMWGWPKNQSGHCCTLSVTPGIKLDYITYLNCTWDDITTIKIIFVSNVRGKSYPQIITECLPQEFYHFTMHTSHILEYGCPLLAPVRAVHWRLQLTAPWNTIFKPSFWKECSQECYLFIHKMHEAIWLALPTLRWWSWNVCNSDWTVFFRPHRHSLACKTTPKHTLFMICNNNHTQWLLLSPAYSGCQIIYSSELGNLISHLIICWKV